MFWFNLKTKKKAFNDFMFATLFPCLDCVQDHIKHSMPLYIPIVEQLQKSWKIYPVSCLMDL